MLTTVNTISYLKLMASQMGFGISPIGMALYGCLPVSSMCHMPLVLVRLANACSTLGASVIFPLAGAPTLYSLHGDRAAIILIRVNLRLGTSPVIVVEEKAHRNHFKMTLLLSHQYGGSGTLTRDLGWICITIHIPISIIRTK